LNIDHLNTTFSILERDFGEALDEQLDLKHGAGPRDMSRAAAKAGAAVTSCEPSGAHSPALPELKEITSSGQLCDGDSASGIRMLIVVEDATDRGGRM
jgi:hypothetical protein